MQRGGLLRKTLLLIAPLLLALAASVVVAQPAHAAPQETEKSIVRLQIDWTATVNYLATGNVRKDAAVKASFSCTGFFVSTSGHIATAGHCVDDADANATITDRFLKDFQVSDADRAYVLQNAKITSAVTRTVWAYQPPGVAGTVLDFDGIKVQVVDFASLAEGDHALLKINNFDEKTPALTIAGGTPDIGTGVTSIGFPGSVGRVSDDNRRRASFKQGKVSSRQTNNGGVPFTEIDASMSQGMSGGPTIDSDTNEAYGVNSFGIHGESGDFNSISDTAAFRSFVAKNGVELTPSGNGPGSSPSEPVALRAPADSGNTLVMILVGIIALLVVGGGIGLTVFLVTRRNRHRDEIAQPQFAQQQPFPPDPQWPPDQPYAQNQPFPPNQHGPTPPQHWQGGQTPVDRDARRP